MAFSAAQWALGLIGLLHLLFAVGELFPWKAPWIMMTVIKKWPENPQLSATGTNLVAMIVHNAGIYNGRHRSGHRCVYICIGPIGSCLP